MPDVGPHRDPLSAIEGAATLDAILRARARQAPDRRAYLFLADGESEAESLTWGELDGRARAVARALVRHCAPGDRALLLYPPGLDFIAAFFGCLYARVVAVPAYPPRPRRDQPRLRAIVEDALPRVALATSALLAGAAEALSREPSLAALRWLATDREEGEDAAPGGEPAGEPQAAAPAFLQYTSGSTALPKGVVVSHANLLHNERMIRDAFGLDESSVVVGWLPLYHDMGLIGTALQPLYCGGRCVLMSPAAFLQRPRRWLEAISRYGGTASGGPNFGYGLCVRKVGPREREGLDLRSWKVAFNGAEPVSAETLERFAAAFAPCGFARRALVPCYGLAEATLLVAGARPGEGARVETVSAAALARHEVEPAGAGGAPALRLVSSGRPRPEQRVVIVDPESRVESPPGRVGEIWVAGPSVAGAYWGNPEASEGELRARLADGSGCFLRTGDLGFLRAGELYVTGRRKDLIILRGRNHYPQDLELAAERAHGALRPGGGAAFSVEVGGDERLVLAFEAERRAAAALPVEEVAAAVRQKLAEEHEVQLHELVLIPQGSLPKTSSGKVQRQACRALYLGGELAILGRSALGAPPSDAAAPEAPRGALDEGAVEGFLRAALARAVRLDPARIDRDLPMSSYGLDSLAAVELRNAAAAELGAAPSLTALLEGLSLAAAAREVAALARPVPAEPSSAAPGGGEPPLSFGQQALWILYGLEPASAAYNLAGAARLTGGVDPEVLGVALDRLVERHEPLRTTYSHGTAGPVQRIRAAAAAILVREDASGWSAEELSRRVREAAFRPFDLESGPVFRAVLFARGAEDPGVLVLAVHHIAADFWSLALLVRELGELYAGGGQAELAAPALRYADLVERQRRERAAGRYDGLLERARRQLAGAPPLDLPLDRPRPALQTWRGTQRGGRLGAELAAAAAALGRRHGATLFMVLLAGFEALLARYGGQEDFLVGTPTAGRSSRALEGVVGYLVNPVPVRADLAGDPEVRTLLARSRRAALDALAREELPFALLAEGLEGERDPSRPAVFQAMLALQRSPRPELASLAAFALGEAGARLRLGGATLESIALDPPAAQFDLLLLAAEIDGDLAAALQVNLDLFDATTAQRMLGHLASLLAAMTRGDEHRLSALAMLSPAEAQQLLREWNATAAGSSSACLPELIAAQAARSPEAVAVACGQELLTYRELDLLAGRLARHLERLGVGPEVRVGICLERSLELIVALLATLRAGGAYVPIDPSYPAERVAYMLADSRIPVILTQEHIVPLLPAHAARTVRVDRRFEWWSAPQEAGAAGSLQPENLAYVLYTSGSTGHPKGAMNSHRGIVNRLLWMQEAFPLTAEDRVLQKTPASFDVSVWEFFWPLMTGARLVVARPAGHLDPAYLRDEIAAQGVTTVHFVPSLLQVFLEQPGVEGCAVLRRVIASGEALSRELTALFHSTLGGRGVALHNLYGPAEAAVDVTWWPCPPAAPALPVPIGRPIANTRIHVLDRGLRPLPVGGAGELHIGGVQVARGYLGRPELTAARFVPDPFAAEAGARLYRTGDLVRHRPGGELEFLGRIDHQVKVRGVRIELGEVERALAGHGMVREAVVAARGEGAKLRLVAYVVPAGGAPDAMALRAHLQEKLPETSIPSAWMFLPNLPLSPSGKVDRRALPEPDLAAVAAPFRAPSTPAEGALAAIWSEVLGRERIGVDDNFFALGGDSILGIQILSRAARAGLALTPRQIFRHPTISELAAVAGQAEDAAAATPAAGEAETAETTLEDAMAYDLSEAGLSDRDLQKLMSKLSRSERGSTR
jgi:amino acid adenylation domain-containing protein